MDLQLYELPLKIQALQLSQESEENTNPEQYQPLIEFYSN